MHLNIVITVMCILVSLYVMQYIFTIMLNDYVLLRLLAQVPEDIGAIEVNYFIIN